MATRYPAIARDPAQRPQKVTRPGFVLFRTSAPASRNAPENNPLISRSSFSHGVPLKRAGNLSVDTPGRFSSRRAPARSSSNRPLSAFNIPVIGALTHSL